MAFGSLDKSRNNFLISWTRAVQTQSSGITSSKTFHHINVRAAILTHPEGSSRPGNQETTPRLLITYIGISTIPCRTVTESTTITHC